ncbi:MAG: hypothetical protein D4R58_02695 [Betaproteobacteria bacterium]|nr:MAG: hypothetical protein D4R58_02695 [Betaproteobacteria bacterium]
MSFFHFLLPVSACIGVLAGTFIRLSKKEGPPHAAAASATILPATGDADADVSLTGAWLRHYLWDAAMPYRQADERPGTGKNASASNRAKVGLH